MRQLPPRITQEEIESAYPDAFLEHCSSCHEDLDYGFTEAIEEVVVQLPDGSLRTFPDSCCRFLSTLRQSGIPHEDGWEVQTFGWKGGGEQE